MTDPNGNKIAYDYDERQLLWRTRKGVGSTVETSEYSDYTLDGHIGEVTNARGFKTKFHYDDFARVQRIDHPNGSYSVETYHPTGAQSTHTLWDHKGTTDPADDEPIDQTTRYNDERGRAYENHYRLGLPNGGVDYRIVRTEWDRSGRLVARESGDGIRSTFEYDGAGRAVVTVDNLGNRANSTYLNGRKVAEEAWDNIDGTLVPAMRQTYVHDALGFVSSVTRVNVDDSNLNRTRSFAYDIFGSQLTTTEADGTTTSFTYDARGLLKTTRRTLDGNDFISEVRQYDAGGRTTSVTDAVGEITSYQYDELNRADLVTFPDGTTRGVTYDAHGNVKQVVDRNGTIIAQTYTPTDKVATRSIQAAPGVLGAGQESYVYDVRDLLLSATTDAGGGHTVTSTYDTLGRRLTETLDGRTTSYDYDSQVVTPMSRTTPNGSTVTYDYDGLRRIDRITRDSTIVAQRTYEGSRELRTETLGNGIVGSFDYDGRGLVQRRSFEKNGQVLCGQEFDFDARGRIKSIKRLDTGQFDVLGYDEAGQVRSATRKANVATPPFASAEGTMAYGFDTRGNRTSTSWTPWQGTAATTMYVIGQQKENRYESVGGVPLGYDTNGNLRDDGTYLYAYDYGNRLVQVRDKANNSVIAEYEYGPLGRRLVKRVFSGGQPEARHFVYDGDEVVEERDADGAVVAEYAYRESISRPILMEKNGATYYYLLDQLGSVWKITDENGVVVESYEYGEFGETTIFDAQGQEIATSVIGNPFRYTAQYQDDETSLYHYRNRAYAPTWGRFLQMDPVGSLDHQNLYQYAHNNPVILADPYGLMSDGFLETVGATIGGFLVDHGIVRLRIGYGGAPVGVDSPVVNEAANALAATVAAIEKYMDSPIARIAVAAAVAAPGGPPAIVANVLIEVTLIGLEEAGGYLASDEGRALVEGLLRDAGVSEEHIGTTMDLLGHAEAVAEIASLAGQLRNPASWAKGPMFWRKIGDLHRKYFGKDKKKGPKRNKNKDDRSVVNCFPAGTIVWTSTGVMLSAVMLGEVLTGHPDQVERGKGKRLPHGS